LIFDIKSENFKSTFFIKNSIHAPLDFCPNFNHYIAWYQQLVSKLALIVFQNFRKWLDKTKLLLMVFTDENYPFWKVKMQIFVESIDRGIWDAILNGPLVPTITVNNLQEPKPFSQWNVEENRRAQYDVRARNIISSTLTFDEFYRISVCTSA